jgi:hypothetical protein
MSNLTRQQKRHTDRQAQKAARSREKALARYGITASEKPFLNRTLKIFALAASFCTILGFAYSYWPTIEVEAKPQVPTTGPMNAKFDFKNPGRVDLFDVQFSCVVKTATQTIDTSRNAVIDPVTGRRGQVIGKIARHSAVTRDCGSFVSGPIYPSTIEIHVDYKWPLFDRWVHTVDAYFVSERGGDGHFWMTPETKP